jgi:lipopolysaccharide export system ATP-binding protein
MSILSVQDISKSYKFREVVKTISLEITSGEVVGLLGPNGAGKTTAFYMIVGLIPSDKGRILLDGQDLTDLPMHKRAALGLGYLPQEASIFRKLSVEQNILAILENRECCWTSLLQVSTRYPCSIFKELSGTYVTGKSAY